MSARPVFLPLAEIFPGEKVFLFENGCNWRDAVQGNVGNCWLIAALSSCGEFPSLVEDMFETKTYTPGQPMKVRLFNRVTRKWQTLSVKDSFPCDKATRKPIFANPVRTEAWVMVLEKAFAMLFGSYEALEGGWQSTAWEILTGNTSSVYFKEGGTYRKYNSSRPKKMGDFNLRRSTEKLEHLDDVYRAIAKADDSRSLIGGCITGGADDPIDKFGLAGGHAYSIIAHAQVGGPSVLESPALLLVRNPWGNDVEWNGTWSDKDSGSWKAHPALDDLTDKIQKSVSAPPGAWWMSIQDFVIHYNCIIICKQKPGTAAGTSAEPLKPPEGAPGEALDHEAGAEEDDSCCPPDLVLPPLMLTGRVLQYGAFGRLGFEDEHGEEDPALEEAADATGGQEDQARAYAHLSEVNVHVITKLFQQVDSDHDGFVTPQQLMAGAVGCAGKGAEVDAGPMAPWLRKLVDQGQSCVTLAELLRINDELRGGLLGGLQLTIKSCDFGNFSVKGVFPHDTIKVLKEKIAAQRPGTPACLQELLFGGLLLDDSRTVSEYITDKAALSLIFMFV